MLSPKSIKEVTIMHFWIWIFAKKRNVMRSLHSLALLSISRIRRWQQFDHSHSMQNSYSICAASGNQLLSQAIQSNFRSCYLFVAFPHCNCIPIGTNRKRSIFLIMFLVSYVCSALIRPILALQSNWDDIDSIRTPNLNDSDNCKLRAHVSGKTIKKNSNEIKIVFFFFSSLKSM